VIGQRVPGRAPIGRTGRTRGRERYGEPCTGCGRVPGPGGRSWSKSPWRRALPGATGETPLHARIAGRHPLPGW